MANKRDHWKAHVGFLWSPLETHSLFNAILEISYVTVSTSRKFLNVLNPTI